MTKHAKLSASGSAKWIYCSGSIEAEKGYADIENDYMLEGTLAHALGDKCFKNKKDTEFYVGKKIENQTICLDMARHVQEYLDYVLSHETDKSQLFAEQEVDYSNVYSGQFGTLDATVVDWNTGICHIFDLKYGQGVKVYSKDNTQGLLYAAGFYNMFDFFDEIETFRIHIVQPRKYHVDYWDISVHDLKNFIAFAKKRAELAMTKNAPRTPGEKQCQWCKAKGDCKALSKFVEDSILCEFKDLSTFEDKVLSHGEKKVIQDNKSLIESFLKANQDSICKTIESGGEFKGYKLVEGRSIRKWLDEAEERLFKKLRRDAYETKLIGITTAEKLIGKEEVDNLTYKPKGKSALVQESDKRKAIITKDLVDEFENLADDMDKFQKGGNIMLKSK